MRAPSTLDDGLELQLRRAQAGDDAAFDALVRAHFARVYGVLFRLIGNHEDAEDLAQECFVRAYRGLASFRAQGSFEGWLVRIAVHLARDHRRRRGVGPRLEGERDVAGGRGPEAELSERELVGELGAAIDRLPEHLRLALVLRVLEGMDYVEIARATGVRPPTVRTQVMKARRLLASWLGAWIEEDER